MADTVVKHPRMGGRIGEYGANSSCRCTNACRASCRSRDFTIHGAVLGTASRIQSPINSSQTLVAQSHAISTCMLRGRHCPDRYFGSVICSSTCTTLCGCPSPCRIYARCCRESSCVAAKLHAAHFRRNPNSLLFGRLLLSRNIRFIHVESFEEIAHHLLHLRLVFRIDNAIPTDGCLTSGPQVID